MHPQQINRTQKAGMDIGFYKETHSPSDICSTIEGRKEMFYLTMHSTFYLRLYGIRHMVKDHSDSERGNPLLPHGLLFLISSKVAPSHRQESTFHSLCYTSRGALAGKTAAGCLHHLSVLVSHYGTSIFVQLCNGNHLLSKIYIKMKCTFDLAQLCASLNCCCKSALQIATMNFGYNNALNTFFFWRQK